MVGQEREDEDLERLLRVERVADLPVVHDPARAVERDQALEVDRGRVRLLVVIRRLYPVVVERAAARLVDDAKDRDEHLHAEPVRPGRVAEGHGGRERSQP